MSFFSSLRICLLAMAVTLLAACRPSEPLGPPGQVTLIYSGESESELFFVLENRSAQEILLPASKSFLSVKPYHSALGCLADDSSYESSIWPGLDGGERREIIRVPPDGQVRLSMDKGNFALPRYRRGPCDVRLLLENHTAIELKNFKH
jgi:hypothetical protein